MKSLKELLKYINITELDLNEFNKLLNITNFKILTNKGKISDAILALDAACKRNPNLIKIFIIKSIMETMAESMIQLDNMANSDIADETLKRMKSDEFNEEIIDKAISIMLKQDPNVIIPKNPIEFLEQIKNGILT